jgi:hypothetical protein
VTATDRFELATYLRIHARTNDSRRHVYLAGLLREQAAIEEARGERLFSLVVNKGRPAS